MCFLTYGYDTIKAYTLIYNIYDPLHQHLYMFYLPPNSSYFVTTSGSHIFLKSGVKDSDEVLSQIYYCSPINEL